MKIYVYFFAGISSILAVIWGLILCGAPCGCNATSRTISILITGIFLSCIMGLVVWSMGVAALFIGAHGKGLLCGPLYDYPKFDVLSTLLDSDGIIYKKGVLEDFGSVNDTLKIAEVLK